MDITTIDPCLTTGFSSAPVIAQNTVDYFPFVNSTITVPLTWALDTSGFGNLHDRCGPYSLKIQQKTEEPQFDPAMMTVDVQDEYHLTVQSREVVGPESVFKTYNFLGWIESPNMRAPSPPFQLAINVHDTCTAIYDLVWAPFSSINKTVGSVTGKQPEIAIFTQTLKKGLKYDPNIECGPVDFEVSVHHQSSSKASEEVRNLITLSSSGTKSVQVAMLVDPIFDASLAGAYTVSVTGRLRNHPQMQSSTSFELNIVDSCLNWNFPDAPALSVRETIYQIGQGDLAVDVNWNGTPCQDYVLIVAPNGLNAGLNIDAGLTFTKIVSSSRFIFHTDQSNLVGKELTFDVRITSKISKTTSLPSTFTVYAEQASRLLQTCTKAGSWLTASPQSLTYDIRNPPASSTLLSLPYIGPSVASCGNPVLTFTKSGALIPFLSASFDNSDPTSPKVAIVLSDASSAIKGTYAIDATFTAPGAKVSSTGLTLIVINSCDQTSFSSAPTLTPPSTPTYYYGQGDLAVAVQYPLDSRSCGGYSIQIALDSTASTTSQVNAALITATPTGVNSFVFNANQPTLSGILRYKIQIGVSGTSVVSPTATWSIGVYNCNQRVSNWITSNTRSVVYDVRNPPTSAVIATYAYQGPPIGTCDNPTIQIANETSSGPLINFLSATFDPVSGNIAISADQSVLVIDNPSVKGKYVLRAVFSLPGQFNFTTGITLTVKDVCDTSLFDGAPVLSPDNQYYYIGATSSQGDLVVSATYTDSVSRTTANICGPYTLTTSINSASSLLQGTVNPAVTYNQVLNSTHFQFFSNQPGLTGTIKSDVRVTSGAFSTPSTIRVWTVNLLSCNQKYRDWIAATSPVQTFSYDVRNPPSSPIIATYSYLGPPLSVCGDPMFTLQANNSQSLDFLIVTFDSTANTITISLPDSNTAVKGTYAISAVFSAPGVFTFPLGLNLKVYDICETSKFDSAPLLSIDNQIYYATEEPLIVEMTYTDLISRTTANQCGPYSIKIMLNAATTTIVSSGQVDPTKTYFSPINSTHAQFYSSQTELSGVLKYIVQIESEQFSTWSSKAVWTLNLYSCTTKQSDWIAKNSPAVYVNYDLLNPPASDILGTFDYLGPPISICSDPQLGVADAFAGDISSFVTNEYDSSSQVITVKLSDVPTRGLYNISAVFQQPGFYEFTLGLLLNVTDSCDTTYFDSAPVLSPVSQTYYVNQGDLVIQATYDEDYVTRTTDNTCGVYQIDVELNYAKSILGSLSPDETVTTMTVIDANTLQFSSTQAGLSGELTYDVSIKINQQVEIYSPLTTWVVTILNCDDDDNGQYPWVETNDPVVPVEIDLSNPPESKLIAVVDYQGPPIDVCSEPTITIENEEGTVLDFLVPTYDDASKTISINIDDFSENYKGSYNLFAVFSQPGDKSYEMGVTLDIFDICEENSSFDAAPELSQNEYNYYVGEGILDVTATYIDDLITRTTDNSCGPYTINIALDSDQSYLTGGSVDSALTDLVAIDDHNLQFNGNQPGLSGILVYEVSISAAEFTTPSPSTFWTLNLYTCDQQYQPWITALQSEETVDYEEVYPPESDVIGVFAYNGPPVDACQEPELHIEDDQGNVLDFLTPTFDSTTGDITITIDPTIAVRGTYSLQAVFTEPGDFTWSLGLNLHFYHICQTSSFESEPTITPANYEYYVDQGNLLLTVEYPQDTVSRDNPGIDCGPFTLITDYDSSVLDSVISATTLFTANDATSINFSTTQSDLSDTITYSVQVTQSEYDFTSLAGYVSIIVRNCETIVDDWAQMKDPVQDINYDLRNPPESPIIATFTYQGPPILNCGEPVFTLIDQDGDPVDFLTAVYTQVDQTITISLPDFNAAVKGDYYLYLSFTEPGEYEFELGVDLHVFDICNWSQFPSAPIVTPDDQDYWTGTGDLVLDVNWAEDNVTATTLNECGEYSIQTSLNSTASNFVGGPINDTLTYIQQIGPNQIKAVSNQLELSGTFIVDVQITSTSIDSDSPVGQLTINVHSCKVKEEDWIVAASSPQIVDYNLVAPTPVPLIATFDYEGPPLEFCSNPQMKVTDANGDEYTFPDADGVEQTFLEADFNLADMTITIILPDGSGVPKRNYPLYISFTQPGEYIFDTGYTLRVYDICDDSTFPEAPTFSPNDDDYWIGFDQDLVLDVSWVKDTAFESSGINCGPYIIDAVYDSPVSIMIGDPIDDTQFTIQQIGTNPQLIFSSTQSKLSGELKFNVKISSDEITAESPNGVLTINVHSCQVKENDWVTAQSTPQILDYNLVALTPVPLIATIDYEGPSLEFCSVIEVKVTDGSGLEHEFLEATFNQTDLTISITLPDQSIVAKDDYPLYLSFTEPGEYRFDTGYVLHVFDICDDSTFPDPPTITAESNDYWIGQPGILVFDVDWTKDTAYESSGIFCGDYDINADYDSANSNLNDDSDAYDSNLSSVEQINPSQLQFSSTQLELSGELKFNVKISSDEIIAESPTGVLTVNVHSCKVKENDWITARLPAEQIDYNLVALTLVPLIATIDYTGPPLEFCSNIDVEVTNAAGSAYGWLTATFNATDETISITLPDQSGVEKGDYPLYLSFTEPGVYQFDTGIILHVFDICDDSSFPDAPTVQQDGEHYWIGQLGDLVVDLDWTRDTAYADSGIYCGDYIIEVVYDSANSDLNEDSDDYDANQVQIDQVGIDPQLTFSSTQPKLSGELKFNVKIVSSEIDADSPVGVWTVNVHSCQVKENDWITAMSPPEPVDYNRQALTPVPLIATIDYTGPSLEFCNQVDVEVTNAAGSAYGWLTATFNATDETISITLPDQSGVDKGDYPLYLSFTEPGVYQFDTGYVLHVYDICEDSTFPGAPSVIPDDQDYWIGTDQTLVLDVTWATDFVYDSTGIDCGAYMIGATYDSAASTLNDDSDALDNTQVTIQQIDTTPQLSFSSTQPKLSGELKFNVKISSSKIIDESDEGVWTVNVHSCKVKENDWITAMSPAEPVDYNRQALTLVPLIATIDYRGPPLEFCSNIDVEVTDAAGSAYEWLTATFNPTDLTISITLPDQSVVAKGDYPLYLSFTEPGEYQFDTGYILHVFDICDDSTFPEAPTVSPDAQDYWIGYDGDLALSVAWLKDSVQEEFAINCGPYEIEVSYDSDASTLNDAAYDPNQTSITQIGPNEVQFTSTQPNLSGELKFNVKIVSDLITADSPEGVWTVNIHSCQVKENDWITTTVSTKNYNVLDTEQSSLIATVPYEGPSLEFCDTVTFTVTDADGTNYSFLSSAFDPASREININYPPESFGTALGTYPLFISFTEPGVYSFDTGVSLRLYDICDESTFPSPPVISPVQDAEYWIALEGVNTLEFNVAWDNDSSTALGFNCGPFEIQTEYDSASSTLNEDAFDETLASFNQISATQIRFSSTQPTLSGELKFKVKIASDEIDADSPEGVWTVNVHSCQVKEDDWITTAVSTWDYNLVDPSESSTVATIVYEGPPLDRCNLPVFTITDADGVDYGFLTSRFEPPSNIIIEYPTESDLHLGTHPLFVSFTQPGVYSFDSGISLHIFDQCDDSEFPSAPVITPDGGEDYWINDPDLTFSVTWEPDTVNDQTGFDCGPYLIEAEFDSDASTMNGDPYDDTLATITQTGQTLSFSTTQSSLSGTLKFNVKIASNAIHDPSDTTVWTINVHSCLVKENDWVDPKSAETLDYDTRLTQSSEIASFEYKGPLEQCGEPVISITDDDETELPFITATYVSGQIVVSFPNTLTDQFGTYSLNAHFTEPADYYFPLGITLEVYDGCEDSTFPNAPVIEAYNDYYYGGQSIGQLDFEVTWDLDSHASDNNIQCGDYSIEVAYNSDDSTFDSGTIDEALTRYEVEGTSILKFISEQSDLSGTLTYDVTIVSTSITAASPTASWTFNIRSCANEYDPWVDVADPTESISFDVSDPLASLELNSYHYEGNPIAICGNLEISIQDDAGSDIEFLSAELVGEDIIVSIDLNSAVLGTYNVVLKFSEPGEQTYSLFELEVIDSLPCKSVATTNTVAKMNDQNFELTGTITFTPDATVSDQYSTDQSSPGLCGAIEPVSFQCDGFSDQEAYLNAITNEATILLNWDATKINQTLTCNFEYHSADYDEVWIGDSFSVLIDDPCVSDTITYTVTMSNVDSEFEYTADDSLVEFWVSFSSSIDDASGQNNFCGPITVTLSANSSVDAFLDYNFDLATRNITISVQTESDSDIGFYENQIELVLDDYGISKVLDDEFLLKVWHRCHFVELEALVFDSYEYYVWQPAFTGQVNVSDDCPTCNCQWELTYDSAGDITYLTLDHNSGELSIYSESWDSASTDDQNLVANITVNYAGYDTMGQVTGQLQYTLKHPCLLNVATITFVTSNPATEYEVCQNQTVDWADFSWTDSISELTSIPNYCGVPNFDAIYLTEYSSDFKAALSITKDSNTNTGHVSYARRMCKRSVASDDPYEFNIELSYDDGWDPITSTDVVGIQMIDRCQWTVLPPIQKFFLLPEYSIVPKYQSLKFNLSMGYRADNETVWAGVPYFCGFPNYRVVVTRDVNNQLVYDSDVNKTFRFTRLRDWNSQPPTSFTFLIFNSTNPNNRDVGAYTVETFARLGTQSASQTTSLKILAPPVNANGTQVQFDPICLQSIKPSCCIKYTGKQPPYFADYPDSSNQDLSVDPQPYRLPIQNVYVSNGNNVSLSTLTAATEDLTGLQADSIVIVTAQDPSFQENIGKVIATNLLKRKVTVEIYCPDSYASNIVVLTVTTGWSCYPQTFITYELPLYCAPCDANKCKVGSSTYFASVSDWKNKRTTSKSSSSSTPVPGVINPSSPIPATQLSISNINAQPINKSDPAIQVPGNNAATYLDYSFNSLVPVLLPNGQLVQVRMCAPNVESISNTGKVTIVFSKPVVPVESSLYEEIAASGVIQANLLLGTEMSDANLKVAQEAYNFTFTIQEITTTNMYLQLNFTNPQAISTFGTIADKIQISFVDSARYFQCQSSVTESTQANSTNKRLLQTSLVPTADTAIPNGFRVYYPLPSQIDPVRGEKITKTMGQISEIVNALIFISVLLALVFEFRLDMLWGGINALQIICCMSYCNVAWPVNISFLFTMLNSVTQFDFLDPFSQLPNGKYLFNWNWSPTDPKGNSLALANGGNLTFLPNIGSVGVFLVIALLYTSIVPIGKLLQIFHIGGKQGQQVVSKITPNTDKLTSQWLRIFLEIFLMLYMFLLLGFEMARQVDSNTRNSFDNWSITTQSILIVPILGLPLLIMWFSVYHSRWFVSYHKVKFFLNYQDKLHQEQLRQALEKSKTMNDKNSVDGSQQGIELSAQHQPLANLVDVNSKSKNEKSIVIEIFDQIENEVVDAGDQKQNQNGQVEQLARKPTGRELVSKMMMNVKSKVRKGFNDRLEAMTVKHSELEEDQKNKLARLHTYDKFATLHKEMNHHSYTSQYYWVVFLLRRFILITVCIKSNDGYWQSSTFIVLSMICSAYVNAIFPFKYTRKNYVENFNEIMIFTCAIMQQVLAGITMSTQIDYESKGLISDGARMRQGLANFVMSIVSCMIAVNVFFSSTDICHQVVLHAKKWYLLLRANQRISKYQVSKQKAMTEKESRMEEVNLSERKLIDQNQVSAREEVMVYHMAEVPAKLRNESGSKSHSSLEEGNVVSSSVIEVQKQVPIDRAFRVISQKNVDLSSQLGKTESAQNQYVVDKSQVVVSNNFLQSLQAPDRKRLESAKNLQPINGDKVSELDIESSLAALEHEQAEKNSEYLVETPSQTNRINAVAINNYKNEDKGSDSGYNVTENLTEQRTRETKMNVRDVANRPATQYSNSMITHFDLEPSPGTSQVLIGLDVAGTPNKSSRFEMEAAAANSVSTKQKVTQKHRLNSAIAGLTNHQRAADASTDQTREFKEMSYKRHQTANRLRMSPRNNQANAPISKVQKVPKVRADTIQTARFTEKSPRQSFSDDEDQLVSIKSGSIDFYDQARSRMNDTFRQPYLESNDSRLCISDESDVEITNRSFGQDYRGDLKSHRLINQSEFDKTEHGEEGDKNVGGTWAIQHSSLLTTKKGDEKALQIDPATISDL